MKYLKKTLDNGLRIVAAPMKEKHSFAIGVWINTGSRNEHKAISGISHFLEHIVFKGTKRYSCQKIKESIEGVGGSFNGFTADEVTCYLVKIPADYWRLSVDILSDMCVYPSMRTSDVEKERQVILEEIKMYKDLPASHVHELLDGLLWPGQQLGLSVLGSNESMQAITRDDLARYQKSRYTAANIVVAASGRMDFEALTSAVAKAFSVLDVSIPNTFEPARKVGKNISFNFLEKDTAQAHVAFGFSGLRRDHPLKYALGLLHVILGANSSSRLFNEIREKRGLAYEIGTQVKYLKDTGAFVVHAGVDNNKLEQSLKLVLRALEKIREEPVPASELSRAKEFYTGQLLLLLEETMDQMLWLGEPAVTMNTTFTLEEVVRNIRKVTAADIREAAKLIFPAHTGHLAVIGRLKGKERHLEALLQ